MTRNPNTLLVDTCFFIALFNPRDEHYADALGKQEWLEMLSVVMPWPILYETIDTRFMRRPETIARFESLMKAPGTEFLDDSPYRLEAYEDTLRPDNRRREAMSLVDTVLHAILEDTNVRIGAMLTFNLRDFGRICHELGVELL